MLKLVAADERFTIVVVHS